MTAPPRIAHGSFFGRRKGHKLRAHQADLIEQSAAAAVARHRRPGPPDLADLFDRAGRRGPARDRLRRRRTSIAEARAFPHLGFIGCEPYVNGMAKILTQIEAHDIGNIRLFAGDAAELLAWAPPPRWRGST